MADKIEISTYWSDDQTKKAVVYHIPSDGYEVDYFLNEAFILSQKYDGRSLQYHEDAAENYVLGIKQV